MDVHRDERPGQAALGERRFARFLHRLVDRQLQAVPRLRRGRGQLAARGRLAHRVHLVARRPRRPAQVLVVAVLEPFLADDFAWFGALVGPSFELFFADLAGVAEDLGGLVFLRVVADEDFFHRHAGEFPLVFFDVVDEVVADVPGGSSAAPRRRRLPVLPSITFRTCGSFMWTSSPISFSSAFFCRDVFRQLRRCRPGAPGWSGCRPALRRCGRGFRPRGATTLVERVRLLFAWARFSAPSRICRSQRRKKRIAKSATATPPTTAIRSAMRLGLRPVLRSQVHRAYAPSTVGRRVRRTVASSTSAGRTRRRMPA